MLNFNYGFFHRLTPNLTELITNVGVSGPLTASMIAAARYKYYYCYSITILTKRVD